MEKVEEHNDPSTPIRQAPRRDSRLLHQMQTNQTPDLPSDISHSAEMQKVRLKKFLAAEASITLPLPTVICPKIRMVRLIVTSPSLILIVEVDGITIHRPGCDV